MKDDRARELIVFITRLVAIVVAIGVAVQGMRWLIIGQAITIVPKVRQGVQRPLPPPETRYELYPPAAIYVAAATLCLTGLVKRKWLPIAWLGLVALLIWSMLLLFSSGAAVLPATAALFILLTVLQTRKLWLAWIELLLLFVVGVLLNYPLAIAPLLATGALLLLLTAVYWVPRIAGTQ